jgi:hypothetical protein
MAKVNYTKMFEESMQRNNSIKRGIMLLRKNDATVLDMEKAVRKGMNISRKEAQEITFKYVDYKDFARTHKKNLANLNRIISDGKK